MSRDINKDFQSEIAKASFLRDKIQAITSEDIDWQWYNDVSSLPSASDNHGMFAHVHSEGAAYMAHAGNWVKIYPNNGGGAGSITFSGLSDTPNAYNSGKFLQSTADGVEWVDIPAGGANATSYSTTGDLPNDSIDGSLARVGCDLLVRCNGEWANVGENAIPAPPEAPDCVSSLEEFNQYTEYKDKFLAENTSSSFSAGLNNQASIHNLVHDVCLFVDSDLTSEKNLVSIDETTFKWGMFAGDQQINITATPINDPDVAICTFKEWTSTLPGFPKTNANQSVNINQDASITGHFECLDLPQHPDCSEIELFLQSSIADLSDAKPSIVANGGITTSAGGIFGSSAISFDGTDDFLMVGDTSTFKFLHDGRIAYTLECWINPAEVKEQALFMTTDNNNSYGFRMKLDSANKLNVVYSKNASNIRWGVTSSAVVPTNQWTHIAVSIEELTNGNGYFRYFVDGVDQGGNVTFNSSISANSKTELYIGKIPPGGTMDNFKGLMQDIRISKKAVYRDSFNLRTTLLANPC